MSDRVLDCHPEQRGREHFSLRVGLERDRAAAVERAVQQEVQRLEIGQLEALDRTFDHALKMTRHAGCRHLLHEQRIVFGVLRNQSNVSSIALIAGSRVGKL